MKEVLKNKILNAAESIIKGKQLTYRVDRYEAESEGEILKIIEVVVGENRITISDDFALIVISGHQYDFEEWRYKSQGDLLNQFKQVLKEKMVG